MCGAKIRLRLFTFRPVAVNQNSLTTIFSVHSVVEVTFPLCLREVQGCITAPAKAILFDFVFCLSCVYFFVLKSFLSPSLLNPFAMLFN